MYLHTTDAHCHADFSKYADFSGLAFGVDLCVDACFPGDWEGLQKFDAFPVKKAYGIHPDLRVSEFDDMSFVESELFSTFLPSLEQYLISADAIGETGLDSRLENRIPAALQRRLFAEQLRLAGKYGLPAVIHCVGMYGAVFEILKAWTAEYSPTMEERLEGKKERRFLLLFVRSARAFVGARAQMRGGCFSRQADGRVGFRNLPQNHGGDNRETRRDSERRRH